MRSRDTVVLGSSGKRRLTQITCSELTCRSRISFLTRRMDWETQDIWYDASSHGCPSTRRSVQNSVSSVLHT